MAICINQIFETKNYGQVRILEALPEYKFRVVFLNTGTESDFTGSAIRRGSIRDQTLPKPGNRRSWVVGKTVQTRFHGFAEIIELVDTYSSKVRFLDTGSEKVCANNALARGQVRDDTRPFGNGQISNVMKGKLNVSIGDVFTLHQGNEIEIIDIIDSNRVQIKFLETGTITWITSRSIRKGIIRDCMRPSVYGIGYVGTYDAVDNSIHQLWRSMIKRVTQGKAYADVTIHPDFLNYSKFEAYVKEMPNADLWKADTSAYHFDKDLIDPTARQYGPGLVCFLSAKDNMLESQLRKYLKREPTGELADAITLSHSLLRDKYRNPETGVITKF